MHGYPVNPIRARLWRRPALWVVLWLGYSLLALGYLAYRDALNGILCLAPLS